jgi:adenylate kinase
MLNIVLIGGPGAGKGTQARLLRERLGIPQVASGELFRIHLKNKSELGELARSYIDKGELVPDDVTIAMIRARLCEPDCAQGVLLDGFPRTMPQVDALNGLLCELQATIIVVPYIHVHPDVLLKRLAGRWTCKKCGHGYHTIFSPPKEEGICDIDGSSLYQREDDTEATQRHRIKVYFEQTAPLIDYFRQRDLLVEINGEQTINEVHRDLENSIVAAKSLNCE